jgi:hypothetical protein
MVMLGFVLFMVSTPITDNERATPLTKDNKTLAFDSIGSTFLAI